MRSKNYGINVRVTEREKQTLRNQQPSQEDKTIIR